MRSGSQTGTGGPRREMLARSRASTGFARTRRDGAATCTAETGSECAAENHPPARGRGGRTDVPRSRSAARRRRWRPRARPASARRAPRECTCEVSVSAKCAATCPAPSAPTSASRPWKRAGVCAVIAPTAPHVTSSRVRAADSGRPPPPMPCAATASAADERTDRRAPKGRGGGGAGGGHRRAGQVSARRGVRADRLRRRRVRTRWRGGRPCGEPAASARPRGRRC